MKRLIIFFYLLSAATSFGQEEERNKSTLEEPPPPPEPEIKPDQATVPVDIPPEFPGGIPALRKYIADNLRYPEAATKNEIKGKCYLKFIVSETGKITNITIVRGLVDCPECNDEAIRLVSSMPDWIPGQHRNKAIAMYYNLPISFRLQ